jgi:polyhydroxyalkanoate synthesis regulator phasin
MVSSELEITKRWNNIMSLMLESASMPTKNEVDELYKELHMLRKRVAKLEKIANAGGNGNGK